MLTSQSEGLPVALLEYGFYKKPVLSTNVGEIGTVIENGVNGVLIASGDVNAFYSELVQLIGNPLNRNLMATKLYEHIKDNYSEEAVIQIYLTWLSR